MAKSSGNAQLCTYKQGRATASNIDRSEVVATNEASKTHDVHVNATGENNAPPSAMHAAEPHPAPWSHG
jgi:hypothetical protein